MNELARAAREASATADRLARAAREASATADQLARAVREASATADQLARAVREAPATADQLARAVREAPATADQLARAVREAPATADQLARAGRAPYPALVRARVARGWPPDQAAVVPFAPRARLTPSEVEQLRTSDAQTTTLAQQLGISPAHVRRIRAGFAWKAA